MFCSVEPSTRRILCSSVVGPPGGDELRQPRRAEPLGAVLAGGAGRRLGGAKATALLGGRPLLAYPLAALGAVLADVVVVAKGHTILPDLGAVPVWLEADEPRHPITGILHALRRAAGRDVLVCAADMPWVTPALVRRIAEADARGAPAVVPGHAVGLEPLLARYGPDALAALGRGGERPVRETVSALGPTVLAVDELDPFANVNTEQDLARAELVLARASGATACCEPRAPYPNVNA